MNKTQFKALVKSIGSGAEKIKGQVQSGVTYALEQYATHGNATPLGNLYRVCESSGVGGYTKLKRFIQDHANVVYVDGKDDAGAECKIFKVRTGEAATVLTPTTEWFNYEPADGVKAKISAINAVNTARNKIQKALDEDNLKGAAKDAKDIMKRLDDVLKKFAE